ncbi:NB-ARC domains-containing protein [Tanacetum coccineum]
MATTTCDESRRPDEEDTASSDFDKALVTNLVKHIFVFPAPGGGYAFVHHGWTLWMNFIELWYKHFVLTENMDDVYFPDYNGSRPIHPEAAEPVFTHLEEITKLPHAAAQLTKKALSCQISPQHGLVNVDNSTLGEIEHFMDSQRQFTSKDIRFSWPNYPILFKGLGLTTSLLNSAALHVQQAVITPNKEELIRAFKDDHKTVRKALKALDSEKAMEMKYTLEQKGHVEFEVEILQKTVSLSKNMVSVSTETITASLIKLSFYMGRIVSCIYEHSFYLGGDKENQQFVFRFTPLVAPIQCAISVTDPNAKQLARSIYVKLTAAGVVRELDLSGLRMEAVEDVVDAVKNLSNGAIYTWGEFVDRRKQWLMETTTLAYGEETLVDKSLLTISSTMVLQMHELIHAMAREIVREESDRPGDRSRLWITLEVCDVLNKTKVTEAIVLVLSLENSIQNVHIDYVEQMFKSKPPKESKINYSGSLDFLSNELKFLYWHGCPFEFQPSNFYPEHIVFIDMSHSHIKKIWATPLCFGRLKVMKLSHCRNLTSTPDFTEIPNLEELILEGCVHLLEVHPSIRMLNKLVALNLRNCTRLASFPCKEEMDSLRVLILSGCLKVYKLIEFFGTINTLVELHVDLSAVTEFPYLFYTLSNLQVLSIGRHQRIESRWWVSFFWTSSLHKGTQQSQSLVFSYLASLRFLTRLNVSDCNISEVSSDIGSFSCLEVLNLSRNKFTCLLTSLSQLSPLKILILNECKMLEEVPELPCSIISFHASSCTSLTKLGSLLDRHRNFSRRMVRLTSC